MGGHTASQEAVVSQHQEVPGAAPDAVSPEKLETLNFKIPADFKKAYKGYAVSRGITMLELLREGFELSKTRTGQ